MRILVVDDNVPSAMTLAWAVESHGYTVEVCHDGRCALEAVERFQPDVILLDLGMPGLNGLQVARALRADPRHSGIKIIAQTGWGDSEMRRRTAEAGFDLHLVKPVDLAVLEDMLALLGRKPAFK
ncbi:MULTISPECIES: response regulator [Asticcacaulis]|uniref:response regulator n=1 Tax=Asticcacaulis TaxID=76890 RepID=UPI001FDA28D0|nr:MULTISPECIES: response regulator [Asticcacaulis]MBP2158165.1 two-component system CheB/CheR fusion protein [Asticcacaulis solisilvae]MDR6799210.1 two-component system CheB/CheR fusion protein [Asticcacaulis sp. BE141]